MGLSFVHILLVLVVVVILFGSRMPKVMGDIAKGIKNFRDELNSDKPGAQEILPPEDKDRKN